MKLPYAEPYRIKMIERIYRSTIEQREQWLAEAKYNLLNLKSYQVFVDLLTDSGNGAMSDKQWAEMMLGDESYAGSASFTKLYDVVHDLFGMPYVLPVHQGRAAENVLCSTLVKPNDVIPGNSHFETTKGHIEYRGAKPIDCTIQEAFDTTITHPFKGNIDLKKLEDVLKAHSNHRVPFVLLTITCNSVGGQPVSMENIRETALLCKRYQCPLFFDAARFAENAYFIKKREQGYANSSIRDIVQEMFSYVDGFMMSAKKDAVVSMGGLLVLRDEEIYQKASVFTIRFEGYVTYGGLSGRDIAALAQGLVESTDYDLLDDRIGQVAYLGNQLKQYGIPVQEPFGGHAIFIDAKRFYSHIPQQQYPAQLLNVEAYLRGGLRSTAICGLCIDRDVATGQETFPDLELLRLALPWRAYSNSHINYAAAVVGQVYDERERLRQGLKIVKERPPLRSFTVELARAN